MKNSGNKEFTPPSAELHFPSVVELIAKGKKAPHVELARLLAAIRTFYTALGYVPAKFQSATNAPVPVEILALVGEALVSRSEWAAINNAASAEAAGDRHAQLWCEAAKYRQQKKYTDKELGRKIAANPAMRSILTYGHDKDGNPKIMKANTIRRIISQPKK
jgi:hypothetical protein